MKKGFSLIELIFVIVIIALLTSLILPNLSITRDDTSSVVDATNIKSSYKSISNYYMAKGSLDTNATKMAPFIKTTNGWNSLDVNNGIVWDGCIKLNYNQNLTLSFEDNSSSECISLQNILEEESIKLGGTNIEL